MLPRFFHPKGDPLYKLYKEIIGKIVLRELKYDKMSFFRSFGGLALLNLQALHG